MAKYVLVALAGETARVQGGPYTADPGVAKLAVITGLDEATVRRHLSTLTSDGIVSREKVYDAKGHRREDRYLLPVAIVAGVPTVQSAYQAERPLGNPPTRQSGGSPNGTAKGETKRADRLVGNLPTGTDAQASTKNKNNGSVTTADSPDRSSSPSVSADKDKRGTRLPKGWRPNDVARKWTLTKISVDEAREQLDQFHDYWCSVPGQRGLHLDWDATWRNWVRRYVRDGKRPSGKQQQELRIVDGAVVR